MTKIITLLLLCLCTEAFGQRQQQTVRGREYSEQALYDQNDYNYDDYDPTLKRPHRTAVTVGINTNEAWESEFSYHYMALPYLGFGGGIGFYKEFEGERYLWGEAWDEMASPWISDEDKIGNIYIRPSIVLYSPSIKFRRDNRLCLMFEPGLQMILPHSSVDIDYYDSATLQRTKSKSISSWRGDWCFWNFRGSINYTHRQFSLAMGYGISNLDIYSIRRHLKFQGHSLKEFYPSKELTHSLFLTLGYTF